MSHTSSTLAQSMVDKFDHFVGKVFTASQPTTGQLSLPSFWGRLLNIESM